MDACFRTASTPSQRLVYTDITTRIPNLTLARRISSCKLYSYVNTVSRTNSDSDDSTVTARRNAGGYTFTRNSLPTPTCSSYVLLNSRLVIRYTDNAGVGRVMSKPRAISGPPAAESSGRSAVIHTKKDGPAGPPP